MIRFAPCAVLALAACSSEPQTNESAAVPAASATFAPTEIATSSAKSLDKAVAPRPGELKTFGDWTVGCDNTLSCGLRSLGPENGVPQDVSVSLALGAGPQSSASFTFDGYEDVELALAVDGRTLPADAAVPTRAIAALADGERLTASDRGKVVATVSLKGVSAALRYVDAVQGRAGTVTAMVARGSKSAGTVPAPPAPPTIVALDPTGEATRPTAAQLTEMRRTAACEADAPGEPQAHALGGGKTLVLLPCSTGAYNLISAMFVLDGAGVTPVRTDAPVGFDETGADSRSPAPTIVNGDWKAGVLTSFAKGRGIGDCGVMQELVWDGARLRLSTQRAMGECRGNSNYITTWRANVVRR